MYQRTTRSPVPVNAFIKCNVQIIFCGFFKTSTVECLHIEFTLESNASLRPKYYLDKKKFKPQWKYEHEHIWQKVQKFVVNLVNL